MVVLVYIVAFLLVAAFVNYVECNTSAPDNGRLLFPRLPPHKDQVYMIAFTADNNDACQEMEPVIQRLEKDLRIKVRRININRRPDFVMLYEAVGGMSTSTVPFFYNRRTAQAISGPSPYDNLKRLAMGSTLHSFVEQPESAFAKSEYDPRRQR
eukprot:gene41916-51170_t